MWLRLIGGYQFVQIVNTGLRIESGLDAPDHQIPIRLSHSVRAVGSRSDAQDKKEGELTVEI
jgi:hypothetical protein